MAILSIDIIFDCGVIFEIDSDILPFPLSMAIESIDIIFDWGVIFEIDCDILPKQRAVRRIEKNILQRQTLIDI